MIFGLYLHLGERVIFGNWVTSTSGRESDIWVISTSGGESDIWVTSTSMGESDAPPPSIFGLQKPKIVKYLLL